MGRCEPCTKGQVDSSNVFYSGTYLSTLGINTQEDLTEVLQIINDYLSNLSPGGAATLQSVTEGVGDNITTNAIQVSDDDNLDISEDSIALKKTGALMGLYRYISGVLSGQVELGNATSNLKGGTATLTVATQDGSNAAVRSSGRLSITNTAVNNLDVPGYKQVQDMVYLILADIDDVAFSALAGYWITKIGADNTTGTIFDPTVNAGRFVRVTHEGDTGTTLTITGTVSSSIFDGGTAVSSITIPRFETATFYSNGYHWIVYRTNSGSGTSLNGGTEDQTADGLTLVFNIPHGVGSTPTIFSVSPANPNSTGFATTADSTNLILTYSIAPSTGTDLSWNWFTN